MPGTLIDLGGPDRSFRVQYGDFVTICSNERRNAGRLKDAVLVTAGAGIATVQAIPGLFGEAGCCPDEATEYYECRMPIGAANCAALLAAGFRWTEQAAGAAKELHVSAAAVRQIREAAEALHRERWNLLRRLGDEDLAERGRARELLAQLEQRARGSVNWQASAAEEYEIPPGDIAPSPRAGTGS